MTVYKLKTEAGTMYISADLVQAAAGLAAYFGGDPFYDLRGESSDWDGNSWGPLPYQTADCRHDGDRMAALVAEYCDMGEVESIEVMEEPEDEPSQHDDRG